MERTMRTIKFRGKEMNYEERYKKAVQQIRDLLERSKENGWLQMLAFEKDFEQIFPELAESEDERIRKTLLDSFRYQIKESYPDKEWVCGVKLKEITAWLEKQKPSDVALEYLRKTHSPSEVSDFQAAMNIAVAKAYDKGMKDGLERQGGKNLSWSDDDERMFDMTEVNLREIRDRFGEEYGKVGDCIDWLISLKDRGCEVNFTTTK